MKETRIPVTNLNLLRSLNALLTCQNVSEAAKLCNVTQSAMSASLKQLRVVFDDLLLIRGRAGAMHLSNKALELVSPTRELLQQIDHFFMAGLDFDIREVEREINIGLPEYAITLLLPKLLAYLEEHAPGLVIQCLPLQRIDGIEQFIQRQIDIGICFHSTVGDKVNSVDLFTDEIACIAREGHPIWEMGSPLPLKALLKYPQLVWSNTSHHSRTTFGQWCVKNNLRRPVKATVHNGMHLFQLIGDSEYVAQATMRYAQAYTGHYEFAYELIERPADYPGVTLQLFWHEISQNDPVLQWLRGVIEEVAKSL